MNVAFERNLIQNIDITDEVFDTCFGVFVMH